MPNDTHTPEERLNVVSFTECTGMAAVLAQDEDEADNIQQLYDLTLQKSGDQEPHGRSPIPPATKE